MYRISSLTLCMLYLATVLLLLPLPTQAQSPLVQAPQVAHKLKTPNKSHLDAADALLQQIWNAQPGAPKFAAIDAVVQAYNQSNAPMRNAIVWLCITYMQDKNRIVTDRWPCCYVLSRCTYEPAIPYLTDVLLRDSLEVMRAVAAEALGGWYKTTGNTVVKNALMQSVSTEKSIWVRSVLAKYLGSWVIDPGPAPDDAHIKAADALLQQIWNAEPGAPKFEAIDAVVQAYKQGDSTTQYAIAFLCIRYTMDKNRGPLDRWPCEYVLSRCAYEPAIPYLIHELLHDEVEAMRAVAAEALGGWYKSTNNKVIYDALMLSARTDTSKWVRDTLAKYLGSNMPTTSAESSN